MPLSLGQATALLTTSHQHQAMAVPPEVVDLFERFRRNLYAHKSQQYNETMVRREYVDPLFEALGWDVSNRRGYAEAYKDVIHEDALRVDGQSKSPDYSFRVGGIRKFFVETKRPSVNLKDDPSPALQLRRYGWSAKLSASILTDFEEFAVYDTRVAPKSSDKASAGRVDYLRGDEILLHWDERIAGRFSREAILRGDFDREFGSTTRRCGTEPVDEAFLKQIEEWRKSLAQVLALRNPELSIQQLNYAVQITIDRIVFLRIAEDRGIEDEGRLLKAAKAKDAYKGLLDLFTLADDRYNSGLFHFRTEKGRAKGDALTPSLRLDDKTVREIVEGLYQPKSPYEFSVLPADILGQVYERFLGQVIRLTAGHRAVIEPKPEVRKAGGVYYTPTFVVRHIVRAAVMSQIAARAPRQIDGFRVLDPACGSGSFLLEAYQHLLDWHEAWYVGDGAEKWSKAKNAPMRPSATGGWRLSTGERRRILLAHIYGVDIDPQAVEVTKLSLLLKVLEGETSQTIGQLSLLHDRALPDLDKNIKCGNSLIGPEFFEGQQGELLEADTVAAANVFGWTDEFKEVFQEGGFDAVVGNPPYVLLQDEFRNPAQLAYLRKQFKVAAFKVDTYHLFMERGLSLVKSGGIVAMITPSNFLTNNHLAELRRLILEKSVIEEMSIVDGGVFAGISVDNAVFALRAGQKSGKEFVVQHVRPTVDALEVTSKQSIATKAALADQHVLFTGTAGRAATALWRKVAEQSVLLGAVADVNFGKQLRDRKKFIRDVIEVSSPRSVPSGYRPCYTGRDVRRYLVQWNGLACLNKDEARSGGCWDATKQDAKNKLLTPQIGRIPEFGIDLKGYQCLNTMFMINARDGGPHPHLLLGQLNSRISQAVWLDRFYDQRRTFPKIKGTYLKEIPIFVFDGSNAEHEAASKRIVELVERVMGLRQAEAANDGDAGAARGARQVAVLERAIDAEFYKLYGLSEAEVRAVEAIVAVPM